jgi:hypothetical protein
MRRFVLVLSAHPRLVAVQSLARQAASSPASGRKATSRAAKDGASTVFRLREKCTRQWLSPYQREPHITRGVDVGKRPVLRWLENGTSVSALWSSSSQRRSVSTRAYRTLALGRRAPCLLLGVACILHPAAATGDDSFYPPFARRACPIAARPARPTSAGAATGACSDRTDRRRRAAPVTAARERMGRRWCRAGPAPNRRAEEIAGLRGLRDPARLGNSILPVETHTIIVKLNGILKQNSMPRPLYELTAVLME